jgi:hypothetical protein
MSDRDRQQQRHRVVHEGKGYIWTGNGWYEERSFMVPADQIIQKLNALLEPQFEAEDMQIQDLSTLLDRARFAHEHHQVARAERLVRRVLEIDPDHKGAAAILSSVLRTRGRPESALNETLRLRRTGYLPLLTSRAAALCDLERWEKAKAEIAQVLAAGGSGEAWSVVHRIKAARPDLYPPPGK